MKTNNKCKRCGKDFYNPYPDVINSMGNKEIATVEWCANCNKVAMSGLLRQASAYWEKGIRPPWQQDGSK